ncbi:hypothetical protein [cf. Phormidesmis sp. LEGE 11477]|uniref:hypothetical protein n=1 Tax=cf. Phormidesmis sp. LEGE 11477 TaxID=1828680 RepID=UPI00187FA987|nr:hypothetical protein [cf. Phormidesmis sp. LEGE 11477]MBE9060556.1 hypothetical protein [cf. Phormidesmis sp. LEGE 11477]
MFTQAESTFEIIKTISKVLSGVSLALISFLSIVFMLVIDAPGNIVRVGGYEVTFTPTLALFTGALSFSFLASSCLMLASLLLIEADDDSNNVG